MKSPVILDSSLTFQNARRARLISLALPLGVAAIFLFAWHMGVRISGSDIFPTPLEVARGILELIRKGLLFKYVVASLFRVTWGFGLAVLVERAVRAAAGLVQLGVSSLQPHDSNPAAHFAHSLIPVAILWFKVTDKAPIFLIFLASVFPITVSAIAAVQNMQPVYLRAAQNFGLTQMQLFRRVIFPATLPQIITGIRIALGVAWLVVVAAEIAIRN